MFYLKSSVGIEARQEDLVISCLKSNFSGGVFTHFKRIAGYRTRDPEEVRKEIESYFKSQGLSRDRIILGIPRVDAIIRHLDLPREVEDNLKQVVLYQVQSYEPSEEDKYYFDYVSMNPKQTDKRLQILLVMVKKAVFDAHVERMRKFGLRPSTVTVGSVALANLFVQSGIGEPGKTFILADLRPNGIEIMAIRDGSLVFNREAERTESSGWRVTLLRELEFASAKLRLGQEDTVEKILLAGEEADAAHGEMKEEIGACELMSSRMRLQTPLRNRPHLDEGSMSIALAYSGIVRRPSIGLNLLPQERRMQQTRWAYIPAIILGLVNTVLLAGLILQPMIQERIMVRRLDQEINSLKGRADRVQALRSQATALEKKIRFMEGLLSQSDMNLEILRELTTIFPADTFLNFYKNTDCTIQLGGSSPAAPNLIPKLEGSPLLMNVQVRGTMFKDPQTGKDRFTFEAKCER
jgi:hypothetical protein